MTLHCPTINVPDPDAFATAGAEAIALGLRRALETKETCTLALSGGSTPGPVYRQLAKTPLDWRRVTVLLADERCVPPTDEQSNRRLIQETLLDLLSHQPAAVLSPDTTLLPNRAAALYDEAVAQALAGGPIDIAVLGIGPDGHIASLFPPLPPQAMGPARAIAVTQDRFEVTDRITLTLPVLTGAGEAIFLLSGPKKKAVWQAMLEAEADALCHPAQAVVSTGRARLVALW